MNEYFIFYDWILEWVVASTHLPNIRSGTWKMTLLYDQTFAQLILGHPVGENLMLLLNNRAAKFRDDITVSQ